MSGNDTIIQVGRNGRRQVRKAQTRGWTQAARAIFLDHLAATCNVTASAAAAGPHWSSAYALRRRDPEFAAQWEAALATGYSRLEAMLMERAMGGPLLAWPEAGADAPQPPDPADMNTGLGLHLLCQHRRVVHGGTRPPGGKIGRATRDELIATLQRNLAVLNKRLARTKKR